MSAIDDSEASAAPAHVLWVELTTRVNARELHFRSGREEGAVNSVVSLFDTTRKLMEENRAAGSFLDLAASMLDCIRPYTARWHVMRDASGTFLNPALRRQFRTELQALKRELAPYIATLATLSGHAARTGAR
jgi:hypothetical protein